MQLAYPHFTRILVILALAMAGGYLLPIAAQAPLAPVTAVAPIAVPPHTFELFPANVALFRLVNHHFIPALDPFFVAVGQYAGNGWICLPLVVLVWLFLRRQLALLLIALAGETALVQVLKDVCRQWRPGALLPDAHQIGHHLSRGSFPSGDAAMALVITCALWPGSPRWLQAVLACYGAFVVYERVYIGVHFPLDVLTGALLGFLVVYAVAQVLHRRAPKPAPAPLPEPRVPVS